MAPTPAIPAPAPGDPAGLTAGELAAAYEAGSLTPSAALAACLARIAAHDGAIGAFTSLDADGARAAAAESDRRQASGLVRGPLDGVPVAVKDNIAVAGLPFTGGFGRFRGRVATEDAPVVARLRAAGAVIVGKLNLHEGALGATTDNPHFGRTVNPLAAGYTAGGSSGGSGAAVAACFVPLALGSDTMGSVRIPAAYCGTFGLKPTRGLLSRSGTVPLSWLLDDVGPLARSADDIAEAIHAMRGFDAADEASEEAPEAFTAFGPDLQDLSGIVVGCPDPVREEALEPAIAEGYARARRAVATLGGTLRRLPLSGWHPDMDRRAGLLVSEAEVAAELEPVLAEGRHGFSETFLSMVDYGRRAPVPKLARAFRTVRRAGAAGRRAALEADVILLPTAPQRAFPHDREAPANQADLTALANFAGLPALALPVPADDGLPASVQLMGRPFSEARLLAVGRTLARYLAAVSA